MCRYMYIYPCDAEVSLTGEFDSNESFGALAFPKPLMLACSCTCKRAQHVQTDLQILTDIAFAHPTPTQSLTCTCKLVDLVRFWLFQVGFGAVQSAPRIGRSASRSTFDEFDFSRLGNVFWLEFGPPERALESSTALSGHHLRLLSRSWGISVALKGALGAPWGDS